MAAFMHFATTCLSRHIPSCQRSPNDNRTERKHPQFCFQVVHNPTPHLGQVAQPASDVCQVPEQRFSDLPVSALGTRPPVLLFNQPPTASMTSPVIDSWFLLLVHVWIPDPNRPYLEKPCRFNGFSQGLRQAIALWILDAPIREAYIAHHPDHFFDLMGALWYTHYDRALIEATHVVNLELLGPYLDIKPHDLRYAWSNVDASLNPGKLRPQKHPRYCANCYTFPETSDMHTDVRWATFQKHYREVPTEDDPVDTELYRTCAQIAEHRLQFHDYFNELHRRLRESPLSSKPRLPNTRLPDRSPPRPADPVDAIAQPAPRLPSVQSSPSPSSKRASKTKRK